MTARFDNRILSGLRFEMIFRLVNAMPGALLQVPQHFLRKIDMQIETRSDCYSSERNLTQNFNRLLCAFFGITDLLRLTGEFLSKPNRCRIH